MVSSAGTCIYPICGKICTDTTKVSFKFPKQPEFLDKWLEKIPFVNFENIDLKSATLCIDHFEESAIKRNLKKLKLKKEAIPTKFPNPDKSQFDDTTGYCRFCLRSFESRKDKVHISDTIRRRYTFLISKPLYASNKISEYVCKNCESEITKLFFFRNSLIHSQKILRDLFKEPESSKIKNEVDEAEIKLEDGNDSDVPVKTERNESTFDDMIDNFFGDDDNDNMLSFGEFRNIDEKEESVVEKPKYRRSITSNWKNVEYICDYCGDLFKKKSLLIIHLRTHLKKYYPCNRTGCSEVFDIKSKLTAHKKRVHGPPAEIFCHLCGKQYQAYNHFMTHLRSKHTGERPFVCDYPNCGKNFCGSDALRAHKHNIHNSVCVKCEICFKEYKNKDTLRKHMKFHSGEVYTCDFEGCGKQFVHIHVLKLHKKVHLGQKDFRCNRCNACYQSHAGLKKHIWSVHMKFKIPCEIPGCGSNFTRKELYRNHVLTLHKNLSPADSEALLLKIRTMKLPKPVYDGNIETNMEKYI